MKDGSKALAGTLATEATLALADAATAVALPAAAGADEDDDDDNRSPMPCINWRVTWALPETETGTGAGLPGPLTSVRTPPSARDIAPLPIPPALVEPATIPPVWRANGRWWRPCCPQSPLALALAMTLLGVAALPTPLPPAWAWAWDARMAVEARETCAREARGVVADRAPAWPKPRRACLSVAPLVMREPLALAALRPWVPVSPFAAPLVPPVAFPLLPLPLPPLPLAPT